MAPTSLALHLSLLVVLAAAADPVPPMSRMERIQLREETRELFYHGYNNYMEHAFPSDVLQPGQCTGAEDWGGMTLTLLDTLDSLALMGNASEFEQGIQYIIENVDFDDDAKRAREYERILEQSNIDIKRLNLN